MRPCTLTLRRNLLAALLIFTGAGAHALGAQVPYDSFSTPDAVSQVMQCGSWGPSKQQNVYRVVHAQRYAQSFVYIQRMQRDAQGELRAVSTLAITELNNDHADISLDNLACRATPRGITVSAQASSGHDDRLRSITIDVDATGQYRYRQRSAPGPVTKP